MYLVVKVLQGFGLQYRGVVTEAMGWIFRFQQIKFNQSLNPYAPFLFTSVPTLRLLAVFFFPSR